MSSDLNKSDPFYPTLPAIDKTSYDDSPPPYNEINPQIPPSGNSQPTATVQNVSTEHGKTPTHNVVTVPTPPQSVQVVLQGDIGNQVPPGVCHICRKGKIKDSATCCSWMACCFLLPFGIIPGLIAFCYACRKPKCTRCGYIHGREK